MVLGLLSLALLLPARRARAEDDDAPVADEAEPDADPSRGAPSLILVREGRARGRSEVGGELRVRGAQPEDAEVRAAIEYGIDQTPGVGILGASLVRGCPAGVTPPPLDETLAAAEEALVSLELSEVVVLANTIEEGLPCLGVVPQPEQLGRLLYLTGLSRFYLGQPNRAADDFRAARSIDPGLRWDERFAPPARALFEEASQTGESVQLAALLRAGELEQLYVDGTPWALSETGRWTLRPGRHLVQWRLPGGPLESRELVVFGGESPYLIGPSAYIEGLPGAAAGGWRGAASRALLAAVAARREVIFVDLAGDPERGEAPAWRYEVEARRLVRIPLRSELREERAAGRELRDRLGSGRDRLRLGVFGGWGRTGGIADAALQAHSVGLVGLFSRLRTRFPLSFELALQLALDPNTEVAGEPARVLPEGRLGLHVHLLRGRLQPSLGIAVGVGLDRPGEQVLVVPSLFGIARLELILAPERGLFLTLEAWLGASRIQAYDFQGALNQVLWPFRSDVLLGVGYRL